MPMNIEDEYEVSMQKKYGEAVHISYGIRFLKSPANMNMESEIGFDIKAETSKALHSLTAKVGWLATIDDDQENLELIRLKWRTFVVYFNPKQDALILPTLLVDTLGSELRRFATLSDPRYNEFEVIVEKRNDQVCFTHGWGDLNEIYGLKHAWCCHNFDKCSSMQVCYSDISCMALQLYVAISRVTSRDGIKLLLIDENGDRINTMSNVAYREVFKTCKNPT